MQVKKRRNKGKKSCINFLDAATGLRLKKRKKKHIRVKFSIGFSLRQIPREFESESSLIKKEIATSLIPESDLMENSKMRAETEPRGVRK